ncbi:acyl-CoA N-acyltransferase [Plectosphaerella cucumerina]|uniref:Acyl-CoA N-acyltransferase n=1 Tax=Plectosphaerella cucumerina TaxID=40658 RepID=A0A8K0TID3_9PEZI|nr:acyl-CoA N-acyltransferase [Plectosphaerella cucumerina]
MAPSMLHLPDGQNFTVTPVFAGVFFKSQELSTHPNAFPIGWTIVLSTEEDMGPDDVADPYDADQRDRRKRVRTYRRPTLQNDTLFISSISNPSNSEFKPAASPTRQIAMMLWITLYWYFHQAEPSPFLNPEAAKNTPDRAKPKGEWRIAIKRDGVLRGRNLIPKLERMGLIANLNSAVGMNPDDSGEEWVQMVVTRRMFWQIPGRLFLFTLARNPALSYPDSPAGSRPGSPSPSEQSHSRPHSKHMTPSHSPMPSGASHASHPSITGQGRLDVDVPGGPAPMTVVHAPSFPIGPFYSTSHLPTYYPPAPLMYTMTNGIRHPLRPKPPRMGEVFYTRFVPSFNQYLSFRVASIAPKPVPYLGPVGPSPPEQTHLTTLSDTSLLQTWLSKPRVSAFWGTYTPSFLSDALSAQHSFPVIAMWDGVPFGYFEIYWVKEDTLGRHLGAEATDWDRGMHVFVGEDWARGRVSTWLSSVAHWCFCEDYRTMSLCVEPRIDNDRFLQLLHKNNFAREREVSLPHKQAVFMRLRRDTWDGPAL